MAAPACRRVPTLDRLAASPNSLPLPAKVPRAGFAPASPGRAWWVPIEGAMQARTGLVLLASLRLPGSVFPHAWATSVPGLPLTSTSLPIARRIRDRCWVFTSQSPARRPEVSLRFRHLAQGEVPACPNGLRRVNPISHRDPREGSLGSRHLQQGCVSPYRGSSAPCGAEFVAGWLYADRLIRSGAHAPRRLTRYRHPCRYCGRPWRRLANDTGTLPAVTPLDALAPGSPAW